MGVVSFFRVGGGGWFGLVQPPVFGPDLYFALERTIGSGVLYYTLEFDIFTGGLGVVGIYFSVAT
jgi:hypothetical protein